MTETNNRRWELLSDASSLAVEAHRMVTKVDKMVALANKGPGVAEIDISFPLRVATEALVEVWCVLDIQRNREKRDSNA